MGAPDWTRPTIRLASAGLLPFAVPAVLTATLWALPGDPAAIICPPAICTGGAELAARWHLDGGPTGFYTHWMVSALQGDFGNSWRMAQGTPVGELLWSSLPVTTVLVALAAIWMASPALLAGLGRLPRGADGVLRAVGLAPSVLLALLAAAFVEIRYGALSHDGWPAMLRVGLASLVLALADGATSQAVSTTRTVIQEEGKARYVGIATLRGEGALFNLLPNVLPGLAGYWRGRMLHLLSGAVVVEVILGVPGLGELLWDGTLLQDFGVVLAAAWAFSWMAAGLLLVQALVEVGVVAAVRYVPARVLA